MEAIALIPQVDTRAAVRMITLGTTAIVSLIAFMYIVIYSLGISNGLPIVISLDYISNLNISHSGMYD